jgi:3D (Asp-Asp-Asp) domain-containing protein
MTKKIIIGAIIVLFSSFTIVWAQPKVGQVGRIKLSSYCPWCSGDFTAKYNKKKDVTKSGTIPTAGRTIAAPRSWKMGTRVWIQGLGVRVVEDRGGAVNNHLDVYVSRCAGRAKLQHDNCWSGPGLGEAKRAYKILYVPKPKVKHKKKK